MKRFLLLVVLFLPLALSAQVEKNSVMPDFKLYRFDNDRPFTKTDITKGKKSLIVFFDATCEHCQHELLAISKQYADFKNVNFYLVTMDEKPQVERFMNAYAKPLKGKNNVTVLLDPDRVFLPAFQPLRFPGLYIFSEDQKLLWHMDGQREVNEILAALK